MGEHSVPICQFYTKHRVWQVLFNCALNFNGLFFCHSELVGSHLPISVNPKSQWYINASLRQSEHLGLALRYGNCVLEVRREAAV